LNFYIVWKTPLGMYCFHVITSKYCDNSIKFRTSTIFTIVIHRSQLYTPCFVSIFTQVTLNPLAIIYCMIATFMKKLAVAPSACDVQTVYQRDNMHYAYGTDLNHTQSYMKLKIPAARMSQPTQKISLTQLHDKLLPIVCFFFPIKLSCVTDESFASDSIPWSFNVYKR